MGYKDAQGRSEWIAQPFIKKGTAAGRVVEDIEPEPPADGPEANDNTDGARRSS